jgi:glycosyltransferase involved in cell wall biosynthesis
VRAAGPRLLVVVPGSPEADSVATDARAAASDRRPRTVTDAELDAASMGRGDLDGVPGRRGRLLRALPGTFGLAAEAAARSRDYDAVVTWGEAVAWPLALALCLRRRRTRHVAILMWPFDRSTPSPLKRLLKERVLPVLARRGVDRYVVPAPVQRRRVVEEWGIAPERMVEAHWAVDTDFWRPTPGARRGICAVGREMRDYETLVTALEGLEIPCHIAAATGWRNAVVGTADERATAAHADDVPPGVTVGTKSQEELRALYADARFVVVPLLPTDSDNGVTTITEAMAMGRAVIATATEGRTELLRDGETCVLVPPQDPAALRAAIERLWGDPAECDRLGAAGRELVLREAGLDQWRRAILAAGHG